MQANMLYCGVVGHCQYYPTQLVTKHPYLGVLLESTMSFRSCLDNISNKATRMLNFLSRNLYRCSQEIKCMAPCKTYAGVRILCVGPLSYQGH